MQLVDASLKLIQSKFHCTLCAETTWLAHPAVKAPGNSAEKNWKKQHAFIQPTIKTTFQPSSVPHPMLWVLPRLVTVNAAGFNQGHSDVMQTTHTCRTCWRIYSKQHTWRLAYGFTWEKTWDGNMLINHVDLVHLLSAVQQSRYNLNMFSFYHIILLNQLVKPGKMLVHAVSLLVTSYAFSMTGLCFSESLRWTQHELLDSCFKS